MQQCFSWQEVQRRNPPLFDVGLHSFLRVPLTHTQFAALNCYWCLKYSSLTAWNTAARLLEQHNKNINNHSWQKQASGSSSSASSCCSGGGGCWWCCCCCCCTGGGGGCCWWTAGGSGGGGSGGNNCIGSGGCCKTCDAITLCKALPKWLMQRLSLTTDSYKFSQNKYN